MEGRDYLQAGEFGQRTPQTPTDPSVGKTQHPASVPSAIRKGAIYFLLSLL